MSYLRTQAFQGDSQRTQADMEPVGGDLTLVRAERPAVGGPIQYVVCEGGIDGFGSVLKKVKKVAKKAVKVIKKPIVKVATAGISPIAVPLLALDKSVRQGAITAGKTVGAMTGLYKPKMPALQSTSYKGFTIQSAAKEPPYYITAAPSASKTPMFADLNQPSAGYPTLAAAKLDIDRVIQPPAGWLAPLTYQGFRVECDPTVTPPNFIITAVPTNFALPAGSTFTGGPYVNQSDARQAIDGVLAAIASTPAVTTPEATEVTGAAAAPQTEIYRGFTFTSYPSGSTTVWYITANTGETPLNGSLKNGPYASTAEAQSAVDLASQGAQTPAASSYGQAYTPAASSYQPSAASSYQPSAATPPAFSASMASGGGYGGSSAADYSFESSYGNAFAPAYADESGYADEGVYVDEGGYAGDETYASDDGYADVEMDDAGYDDEASYDDWGPVQGLGPDVAPSNTLAVVAVVGLGLWLLSRASRKAA